MMSRSVHILALQHPTLFMKGRDSGPATSGSVHGVPIVAGTC